MLNFFTVTASNKHHWQTLGVWADSAELAAAAFRANLKADTQTEEYEYFSSQAIGSDEERDAFSYSFDDEDVELVEDRDDEISIPMGKVELLSSGPNG